jgi:hypothetical protein
MIPRDSPLSLLLTKSDDDPTSFTPVGSAANLTRCAPLSLQLLLELVEKAPVGALGDDFLRSALDQTDLVQA